jgi:hypothetical protein
VQKVYDRVLSMTKPGSIVLLHDIHETTVNAMPATLDALIERGYQMVTVTQLINLEAQNAPVVPAEPAVAAEEPKPLPVQVETEAGAAVLATEPPVGNP